ncbi:MAG: hypothetical protein M1820_001990 [Bogoriella megaspora]|nr:MAG: hypothetical protein M1820_001990 [Bogoriella megaspora]
MSEPVSEAEQARLGMMWGNAMGNPAKFVRYDNVEVLMLSWDDTCDDLKTQNEVDELKSVFEDEYNYNVRVEKLNHEERAQIQMNVYLSTFVRDAEKRKGNTLLIIYYAGHGWSDASVDAGPHQRELLLAGKTSQKAQKQLRRNSVMWKQAEENIKESEADVLLIFDCCYAGLACRSNEPKRFEALAACTADAITKIPGKSSFTSALIWALKDLRKRSDKQFFPTSDLRRAIVNSPDFPKDQYPDLAERVPSMSHIVIAPLNRNNIVENPDVPRETSSNSVEASYIDLRFHCNDERLDDESFLKLADALKSMRRNHDTPVHRIEFLGKDSIWTPRQQKAAVNSVEVWKRFTKKRKLSNLDVTRPQDIDQGLLSPLCAMLSPQTATTVNVGADPEIELELRARADFTMDTPASLTCRSQFITFTFWSTDFSAFSSQTEHLQAFKYRWS